MLKQLVGYVTSLFGRFRRAPTPKPEPEGPTEAAEPRVVAEVVAEAPLVSDHETADAIRKRLPGIQKRFQAAVVDRIGLGFEAGRPMLNEGSLELIVPVLGTIAMTANQYGGIRQGLSYLADDLAAVFGIELRRAGRQEELVDGYWRPPLNWQTPTTSETTAAPPDTSDTTLALWLVGAGTFLTATLGLIGATDADVDRLRVNHPLLFNLAIFGVVLAVLTGVLWPVWRGRCSRRLKRVLTLAVLIVGGSTVGIAWAATNDLSAKARPRITAKLERAGERTRLVGTVTATGLQTKEHILVRIAGLKPRRKANGDEDRVPIYNGRTGPNVEGNVEVTLDSFVPTGVYERLDVEAVLESEDDVSSAEPAPACDVAKRTFGCVSLATPFESRRPRIHASWKAGARLIDIRARMTGLAADDRVVLTVRRKRGKEWGRRLYAASWAPDSLGVVEESLQLEADPSGGSICVIMRALRGTHARGSEERLRRGPCKVRSRGTAVFLGTPERET